MIKLLLVGFTALGLGLGVLIKAVVMIRRGAPYTFGHLDGAALLAGRTASPWVVLFGTLVYIAGTLLVLAFPLGLYDRLAESRSACLEVVSEDELRRIGGASFSGYEVQELGSACSARARDERNDRFELTVDGFGGSWAGQGEAIRLSSGRTAYVHRTPGARLVRVEHGRAALEASLPERAFDEAKAREIAELLDERRAISARYAELASATPSSAGRLLRRTGPWICPTLVGLFVMIAGAVILRRRSRAAASEQ